MNAPCRRIPVIEAEIAGERRQCQSPEASSPSGSLDGPIGAAIVQLRMRRPSGSNGAVSDKRAL